MLLSLLLPLPPEFSKLEFTIFCDKSILAQLPFRGMLSLYLKIGSSLRNALSHTLKGERSLSSPCTQSCPFWKQDMFTVMREKFLEFHAPLGIPVETQ